MDTPSDALGVRVLRAMKDMGFGDRTSVHADGDRATSGNEDRSVETDTPMVRSGDRQLPKGLKNTARV